MNIYQPSCLSNVKCVPEPCKSACCAGWSLSVNDASIKQYETEAPELLEVISNENGGYYIDKDPITKECLLMNDRGYCNIHVNHSFDMKPKVCQQFPDSYTAINDNDIIYHTASLACPEVTAAIFNAKDEDICLSPTNVDVPLDFISSLESGLTGEDALYLHKQFMKTIMQLPFSSDIRLVA